MCSYNLESDVCQCMGVDLWNGLGDEVKESTNINHLKNYPKRNDLADIWKWKGCVRAVPTGWIFGSYVNWDCYLSILLIDLLIDRLIDFIWVVN